MSSSKKQRRNPKEIFPDQQHIIEFAFSVGGVDYYQFNDIFQVPFQRGVAALVFHEETRMKCSLEYLKKHTEATRKLLREKKIDIYQINMINEQLAQRINFSMDTNLLYKLASVVFFDENENPARYEQEYCQKKIKHWKEHKSVNDFFLQKPLTDLIPYLATAGVDLNTYSQSMEQVDQVHSDVLQQIISKTI